jgi:hypothetical protein
VRPAVALAVSVVALYACARNEQAKPPTVQEKTLVRVVRFHLPSGQEEAWLSACRGLARAAGASKADAAWLLHRSNAGDYFVVTFGTLLELQEPGSIGGGFVGSEASSLRDEFKRLHSVGYEVLSDEVWEQVPSWSTVDDMSSTTHPGVDQRSYWVRPGGFPVVDVAFREMATLLKQNRYPYPTEGFRSVFGSKGTAHMITFFGERGKYYESEDPRVFLEARGLTQRWRDFEERLAEATYRAERVEALYLDDGSYDSSQPDKQRDSGG